MYRPDVSKSYSVNAPAFWVMKDNDKWKPINVVDEEIIREVANDIDQHGIE
jgi:hypothetical protein